MDKKAQTTNVHMLYSFVLLIVLVGMVIGVGIIVLDKLGSTTYYNIKDINETITPTSNNSITALNWGNITLTKVYNDTSTNNALPTVCYKVNTTEGDFQVEILNNGTCIWWTRNIYIIYDAKNYATATRDATISSRAEVANISSDWIGLIVTVTILSIILGLVLLSFRPSLER